MTNNYRSELKLLYLLNSWIEEKNQSGTKFNPDKLDRLNEINLIVAALFGKNAKKIEFNPPSSTQKYCFTFIVTESIDIVELKHKALFQRLVELTDTFAVNAIDETTIHITFSVDNIWE